MRLAELASPKNLHCAWERVNTGSNQQYKRYFRPVLRAYELSLTDNLEDLSRRIIGGSYEPIRPERIYLPKPSGLHRPISLLTVEDQIVLQAIANLAAKQVAGKRSRVTFKAVFSNVANPGLRSPFFFTRWQHTYAAFQSALRKRYAAGLRWVADFDLAAFYDTLSHELLIRSIWPRTHSTAIDSLRRWLSVWSSNSRGYGHGIPQGPLASDFLAECFLLPIDLKLRKCLGYLRYVDDFRLMGSTEDEVRRLAVDLERIARERGLVPQAAKFSIKRASSEREALGMLPSIASPRDEGDGDRLKPSDAERMLAAAVKGRPKHVVDKTRFRFVLFRTAESHRITRLLLSLLPRHPEHADALFHYFWNTRPRKSVERACTRIALYGPYDYIRGEAFRLLGEYAKSGFVKGSDQDSRALVSEAIKSIKQKKDIALRMGACSFLVSADAARWGSYARWTYFESALVQACVGPELSADEYSSAGAVPRLLRRSTPEPGLSVVSGIHSTKVALLSLGVSEPDLQPQVRRALGALGVIGAFAGKADVVGEIVARRFGLSLSDRWRTLLGPEYQHAAGLLVQADTAFKSSPSFWLTHLNGFNQCLFLKLQERIGAAGGPGKVNVLNPRGELIDFGVTLDPNNQFSRAHPLIADAFRECNARRNRLPTAHPYDKKSRKRNAALTSGERGRLVPKLRIAYRALMALL